MHASEPLENRVGAAEKRRNLSLAVAESLTGGLLSNRLAAAPDSSEWFAGGVVAYSRKVKHTLLAVPPGPVVSAEAALAMASGAAHVLQADVAVAVTGVGGPDEQDGEPPGTVWLAVYNGGSAWSASYHFDGSPVEICERTCDKALQALLGEIG
jgi:nicotinamide-nucleotide amidase